MPHQGSYGPPLRGRIMNGKLEFFDGRGWIGIHHFLEAEEDVEFTIEDVGDDLASALEAAAEAEEDE